MAQKITYSNKNAMMVDPTIADTLKIKAEDMNELKSVINQNADIQVSSSDASVVNIRTVTEDWYHANYDQLLDNTIYITNGQDYAASTSTPVGAIVQWPGSYDKIPINYMLCEGQLVSREKYATLFSIIGTTYGSGDGVKTFALPNYKGRVPVHLDSSQTEFNTLGKMIGSKEVTLDISQMPKHGHGSISGSTGGPSNNTTNWIGDHGHSGSAWTDAQGNHQHPGGHMNGDNNFPVGFRMTWGDSYNGVWITTGSTGGVTAGQGFPYIPVAAGSHGHNVGISIGAGGGHAHDLQSHTHTFSGSLSDTGESKTHNNIQPSIITYYIIKVAEEAYTDSLRNLDKEVAKINENIANAVKTGENGLGLDITGSNLNDMKNTGFFSGNNLVNGPESHIGGFISVLCHHQAKTYVTQVFYEQNGTNMWIRNCAANIWSSWLLVNKGITTGIVGLNDCMSLQDIINKMTNAYAVNRIGNGNVGIMENTNLKNVLGCPDTGNYIVLSAQVIMNEGTTILIELRATALYTDMVSIGYITTDNIGVHWSSWFNLTLMQKQLNNTVKTGDNGLAVNIDSQNLNNLKQTGFFSGNGLIGGPKSGGYLLVLPHHTTTEWCTQIFFEQGGVNFWIRSCANNVWSVWINPRDGLAISGFLGNTANIDNYRGQSGIYGIYGTSNPINGSIATLEVISYTQDWCLQRLTSLETGNMWERRFHSGTTWTGWVQRW